MVSFYTGLLDSRTFELLYDYLRPKARNMNYWKGEAQVRKERQSNNVARSLAVMFDEFKRAGAKTPCVKRGPKRKLQLEEELLLTLMRLRFELFVEDLAFRFKVSHSLVTQFFFYLGRFMSRELNWMIMWPSRGQILLELPEAFREIYPKVSIGNSMISSVIWYKYHE